MTRSEILKLARETAEIVATKNKAYGNSFAKVGEFFKLLYPKGIRLDQYANALLLARMFDKQMRIATDPSAFSESPYQDLLGYSLLGHLNAKSRKLQKGSE